MNLLYTVILYMTDNSTNKNTVENNEKQEE